MREFTKNQYATIEKVCGADVASQWKALFRQLEDTSSGKITIVNTGMVSSGKSSLFNAFTGHVEDEYFPTGAARTTTASAKAPLGSHIILEDTPGIDVKTEDDAVAFQSILQADIILVIHNIKTGPLLRSEADWIQRLVSAIGSVGLAQKKLVFVGSWADERDRDEDYEDLIASLKAMVFDAVGGEIPFFTVSAKRYFTAMRKNSDSLRIRSNIPVLQSFLEDKATLYLKDKDRMNRTMMKRLGAVTNESLINQKASYKLKRTEIMRNINSNFDSVLRARKAILETFEAKRMQYKAKLREYNNI